MLPTGSWSKAAAANSSMRGRDRPQSAQQSRVRLPPRPRPSRDPPHSRRSGRYSAASLGGGRSRRRNPGRTRPAALGLVSGSRPSFPLAVVAATTHEAQAGPPISVGLGRSMLGAVVPKKTVASRKTFAKLRTELWFPFFELVALDGHPAKPESGT